MRDIIYLKNKKTQPYETTVLFIVRTLLRMLINTVLYIRAQGINLSLILIPGQIILPMCIKFVFNLRDTVIRTLILFPNMNRLSENLVPDLHTRSANG